MEESMRFVCLGYREESKWDAMSEEGRAAFLEECFAYDDELRRGGHFVAGAAFPDARNAATLRLRDGQAAVTDGPHARTREPLGQVLFLEARDLNHAIQLVAKHPGVRVGAFEIRSAVEGTSAPVAARRPGAGIDPEAQAWPVASVDFFK
jgi:hypothetical protein